MSKPTVDAERYFNHANNWLFQIVQKSVDGKHDTHNIAHIAMGLTNMAYGLSNLAVGLRATYMKLEEIERLLKQPKR